MISTAKITSQMATVTRAAITLSVNGMVWIVQTTCQRSLQMAHWWSWS